MQMQRANVPRQLQAERGGRHHHFRHECRAYYLLCFTPSGLHTCLLLIVSLIRDQVAQGRAGPGCNHRYFLESAINRKTICPKKVRRSRNSAKKTKHCLPHRLQQQVHSRTAHAALVCSSSSCATPNLAPHRKYAVDVDHKAVQA